MLNLKLAELCAESYDKFTFRQKGVDVLYRDIGTHHVYAFAGTSLEWTDIIRNLSWWGNAVGDTEGHAGYVKGWKAVKAAIEVHIDSLDDKPIILTGHSMGGAIAVIGAYDLSKKYLKVTNCVTFGAPPSLDFDAMSEPDARWMLHIVSQVEHVRDPIPSAFNRTSLDRVNRVNIGGLFRRPFWMRRQRFHGIKRYIATLKGN
jgi:pimeloyl-ACP methyl ester carboxylesterase